LNSYQNTDLPDAIPPNNIVCPYWDDLDPGTNGQVRIGTIGSAPNRTVVVSWIGVPHWPNFTPTYAFQALLHETSNDITLQYQEVQPTDTTYGQGRDATIGIENANGLVARKYSYNGTVLVTNNQAILFTMTLPFQITSITREGSNIRIAWPVLGGQSYVVQATDGASRTYSNNFTDISPLISALGIGASTTNFVDGGAVTNVPARYYRIHLGP
jgi:hypothetical protein